MGDVNTKETEWLKTGQIAHTPAHISYGDHPVQGSRSSGHLSLSTAASSQRAIHTPRGRSMDRPCGTSAGAGRAGVGPISGADLSAAAITSCEASASHTSYHYIS